MHAAGFAQLQVETAIGGRIRIKPGRCQSRVLVRARIRLGRSLFIVQLHIVYPKRTSFLSLASQEVIEIVTRTSHKQDCNGIGLDLRVILYRKVELGPVGNGFLENQFPAANHLAHAQIFVITFQFYENAGRVAVDRSVFHIAFHSHRTITEWITQRGIDIRDIHGYCPDNTGNEQFHAFPAEYHRRRLHPGCEILRFARAAGILEQSHRTGEHFRRQSGKEIQRTPERIHQIIISNSILAFPAFPIIETRIGKQGILGLRLQTSPSQRQKHCE